MFISYLVSGISDTDSTIEVPDGSIFPQNQVFDFWLDQEELACTSWASADVMNVQRGHEGTIAVSHDAETLIAIDTEVKQNIRTSKALDDHISATVVALSGTSLPLTGVNGQVFLDSDLPGAYIWIP